MITKITMSLFKDVKHECLEMKPLTLLMGHNSAGKSSCIQAVLCTLYHCSFNAKLLLAQQDFSFDSLANKYENAKSYKLKIDFTDGLIGYENAADGTEEVLNENGQLVDLEKNVFYLGANRLGYKEFEDVSLDFHVGTQGEYLFGEYHQNKSKQVIEAMRVVPDSDTLAAHLNYWLSYILDTEYTMDTEEVSKKKVHVEYGVDGLDGITPEQLGVGVSYLAKVLIMCLRSQRGDVLMIENPEIHLHPAACARLGEFLVYIAKAGVQLIIETHNEHIISMLQYSIYKGRFDCDDAVAYYKSTPTDSFLRIDFDRNGKLSQDVPSGFFDATLAQLIEMQ